MPHDPLSGSLLPAGISLETLEPQDEGQPEDLTIADDDDDGSDITMAPLNPFERNKSVQFSVDHSMNDNSPQKLPDLELLRTKPEPVYFTERDVLPPRCTTPIEDISASASSASNLLDNSNSSPLINQVTPTKPPDLKTETPEEENPWTPTANLKVLMSAASPEIRNMELQKKLEIDCGSVNDEGSSDESSVHSAPPVVNKTARKRVRKALVRKSDGAEEGGDDSTQDGDLELEIDCCYPSQGNSRKDKSLGLLCHRFLTMFPQYPAALDKVDLCLDEVAKELGVERRRIYDIVNVLESVEIVSRIAKNKYKWHGKTNLKHTLSKLKTLAAVEGFTEQIAKIRDFEIMREVDGESSAPSSGNTSPTTSQGDLATPDSGPENDSARAEACKASCKNFLRDNMKKDKSLGIMSQRFIMLFLATQPKTVNLDLSAKILVGDPNIDKTENAKFKTKIRRLYDIANILTSLELIKKVHVTEVRGRKPAFKYIGPDVSEDSHMETCTNDGHHRPSSKHSLLDCIQNPQVCSLGSSNHASFKPSSTSAKHSLLLNNKAKTGPSSHRVPGRRGKGMPPPLARKSLARHSSFDQICEVAELERTRLYFESSRSQPSSPNKAATSVVTPTATSSKPSPSSINNNSAKQLAALQQQNNNNNNNNNNNALTDNNTTHEKGASPTETAAVNGNNPTTKTSNTPKTVILKAVGTGSRVLSITETQLKQIVKSLGTKAVNPVSNTTPAVSTTATTPTDTSITQTSPELVQGLLNLLTTPKDGSTTVPKVKVIRFNKAVNKPPMKSGSLLTNPPSSAPGRIVQPKVQSKDSQVPPKRSLETGSQELQQRTKVPLKRHKSEGCFTSTSSTEMLAQVLVQEGPNPAPPTVPTPTEGKGFLQAQLEANRILSEALKQKPLPPPKPAFVKKPIFQQLKSTSGVGVLTQADAAETRSQPNTPSFSTLLGEPRPASAGIATLPEMIESPPNLNLSPNLVTPQPITAVPAPAPPAQLSMMSTLNPPTFISPLTASTTTSYVLNANGISPLQPAVLDDPLLSSGQIMLPQSLSVSPPLMETYQINSTPTTVPTNLIRPAGGYPPTSNNIINLVPFFGSPTGKTDEVQTAIQPPTAPATATSSAAPQIVQFIGGAPVNPITVNGKPIVTPGCFYRTPEGLQPIVPPPINHSVSSSAFQVVNRFTIYNEDGLTTTARRLNLT